MQTLLTLPALLAALLGFVPALRAANITWTTSTVSGPAEVSTTGTLVGALNAGGTASKTVAGVTFAADPGGTAAIPLGAGVTVTFDLTTVANGDFWGPPDVGGDIAYAEALDTGRWNDPSTPGHLTFNGLSAGRTYVVQLWITDTRGPYDARVRSVKGDETVPTPTIAAGPNLATGVFTATGTQQVITITGDNVGPQVNLLQLRERAVLVAPASITSSTNTTDIHPAVHLISGNGLSATPTLAALGTHALANVTNAWVTAANVPYYFSARPEPVLTCTFSSARTLSELVVWGLGAANGNEARIFEIAFSTDNGVTFDNSVTITKRLPLLVSGAVRLPFTPRLASGVRVRITDNHVGDAVGGDRVGLGELRFTALPDLVVTNGNNSGPGSLRQAVADAEASPGGETITFDPTLNGGTITLASQITINSDVILDATSLPGGLTIDDGSGDSYHLFAINSGTTVTLRGLTLANGGGDFFFDYGGAIQNHGTLTLTQCTLSGNSAGSFGGAIDNSGTLTLTQCTLSGNSASAGGAIASFGTLTLTQCTLSGNSASVEGGAILAADVVLLDHCTLSGNSARRENSEGGAILVYSNSRMRLQHCTVEGNSCGSGGGGGVGIYPTATLTLENSIVAGNTATSGALGQDIREEDDKFGDAIIEITGASLVGNNGGTTLPAGPLVGTPANPLPALLAPLGDYGGPTQTMALLPGSPARNAAVNSAATSDQRGFPLVGLPDLGAYEAGTTTNYNAWIYETLPATATPAQHDAAFDFDGDGASNQSEWSALTNPAGNQVFLRLTDCTIDITNSTVTFSTIAGLQYQLQSFHHPEALLWRNEGSRIVGTGSPMTVPVSKPGTGPLFFRVVEGPPPASLNLVTVGNPGNAADPEPNGLGGNSGAVAYEYKIGKYEVTNGEYCTFLNAVDPNGLNALALYNASMGSDADNGGITFTSGNANGAKYTVKAGFARKPVVYVSFYDAMRFCNWLHNGALAGGDTENGAYTLLGNTATPSNGTTVTRNAGAKFAVPSEDEWYKAAYHQPQAQGGDTDSYWLYPTKSNSAPSSSAPPGTAPAANYDVSVGSVSTVGAYTTTVGFYGTFDMAGNVFEWEDTIRSGSSRVLRGGSWDGNGGYLPSDSPSSVTPGNEYDLIGFRVSSP